MKVDRTTYCRFGYRLSLRLRSVALGGSYCRLEKKTPKMTGCFLVVYSTFFSVKT